MQISGFLVPSLTKREARTTVELRDGQSFAIAGLLSAINRRDISAASVDRIGARPRCAVPQQLLPEGGDRSGGHRHTPSGCSERAGQKLASPLDNHIPTNDVDFFLMGQMEQRKVFRDYITSGGGIQGPYGHMIGRAPGPSVLSTKN